jgi:hypothetical protein
LRRENLKETAEATRTAVAVEGPGDMLDEGGDGRAGTAPGCSSVEGARPPGRPFNARLDAVTVSPGGMGVPRSVTAPASRAQEVCSALSTWPGSKATPSQTPQSPTRTLCHLCFPGRGWRFSVAGGGAR